MNMVHDMHGEDGLRACHGCMVKGSGAHIIPLPSKYPCPQGENQDVSS